MRRSNGPSRSAFVRYGTIGQCTTRDVFAMVTSPADFACWIAAKNVRRRLCAGVPGDLEDRRVAPSRPRHRAVVGVDGWLSVVAYAPSVPVKSARRSSDGACVCVASET